VVFRLPRLQTREEKQNKNYDNAQKELETEKFKWPHRDEMESIDFDCNLSTRFSFAAAVMGTRMVLRWFNIASQNFKDSWQIIYHLKKLLPMMSFQDEVSIAELQIAENPKSK